MHIFDSLMYADVDEEGFDTLFEEHPGVLGNIKRLQAAETLQAKF